MKKSLIIGLLSLMISGLAMANNCYTSSVTPEFGDRYSSYSVDIPSLICVKHASSIIIDRRSAYVQAEILVGSETKNIDAQTYQITKLDNGEYIVKFDLLTDSDGSFCGENVGYRITAQIKFNAKGVAKEMISLKGYAYSTYDNCHDTSPEYIDLEFENVTYTRD